MCVRVCNAMYKLLKSFDIYIGNVVGEITEGGIEVDPERLPSILMQFAEYYMAVKSLQENPI